MRRAFGRATLAAALVTGAARAQLSPPPSVIVDDPFLHRTEGRGPYKPLILRGAYMSDGTGAPAQGSIWW